MQSGRRLPAVVDAEITSSVANIGSSLHRITEQLQVSLAGPTPTRRPAWETSWSAADELCDEVDHRCQDDRSEQVRQQGMTQCRRPDRRGLQTGVRHLVAHAEREGEIGEVAVVGPL